MAGVYVSRFLAEQEQFKNKNTVILHNAIENDFLETATRLRKKTPDFQNVLMVCSLKAYKGVNEFVSRAELLSQYQFNGGSGVCLHRSQGSIHQGIELVLPDIDLRSMGEPIQWEIKKKYFTISI